MANIELGFMRHKINDYDESKRIIDFSMAHNITHFESCYFYLNGECDNFLYSLLKNYKREDFSIINKMPINSYCKKIDLKNIFYEQLKKVPKNYFDIYLLQGLDFRFLTFFKNSDIIDFLIKQKELGYIKRLGISIQCTSKTLKEYLNLYSWDIVQLPLNYYDWYLSGAKQNYELLQQYDIPIIAQAPLKGGYLLEEKIFNSNQFMLYDRNLAEGAYDFFSNLNNLELILCGNSKINTLKNTYNYLNNQKCIPLSFYKTIIENIKEKLFIKCSNCGICDIECKQNLPISALINLYNQTLKNQNILEQFNFLGKSLLFPKDYCKICKQCIIQCPDFINLPEELRKIRYLRT